MKVIILALLFVSAVYSHGHVRCLDGAYDPKTRIITSCNAGIRNEALELGTPIENYLYNREPNSPMCQSTARGVANLASYYSPTGTGGKAKMGNVEPGQQLTILWYARNHAQAKEQPRDVAVYMSPRPIAPGQTDDFTLEEMLTNKICQGPYVNCGAGLYGWVDPLAQVANNISCELKCWVPTTKPDGTPIAAGVYTVLWRWDWPAPNRVQHTCGDLTISPKAGVVYPKTSLVGVTGACGDSTYCGNICGQLNVTSCNCNANGWLDKVCNNDRHAAASSMVPMIAMILAFLALFV